MSTKLAIALACVTLAVLGADEYERLIVIGDLHGDIQQGLRLLTSTNTISYQPKWYAEHLKEKRTNTNDDNKDEAIDKNFVNKNMVANKRASIMAGSDPDSYHWCGGKSLLVIPGDCLNVGPADIEIARLIMRLEREAKAAGGHLEFLLGNHEVNNLNGNFDGVHPWSFEMSGGKVGRERLLSTATPLGRFLRTRRPLFLYQDLIFMHGGMTPKTIDVLQKRMGLKAPPSAKELVDTVNKHVEEVLMSDGKKKDELAEVILNVDYESNGDVNPLLIHPLKMCKDITEAVATLKLSAEVVGHTPHDPPQAMYCHSRLFAVDFKMSQWKAGEGSSFAALTLTKQPFLRGKGNTGNSSLWHGELTVPDDENNEDKKEDMRPKSKTASSGGVSGFFRQFLDLRFLAALIVLVLAVEFARYKCCGSSSRKPLSGAENI